MNLRMLPLFSSRPIIAYPPFLVYLGFIDGGEGWKSMKLTRTRNVGQFIWIDLSGFLKEKTVEEERKLAWKMVESGVWFATGEAFKSEIPGYFRLTFATHEKDMRLGMDR